MRSLAGKVAVITGGTSGIGARTAALFVEEGAKVVIAGRRGERGQQLVQALGECARFVPTDVTVDADVSAMIEQAVTWFGRIDCLVNNAGTGSQWVGIGEVDLERFDAAIALHVRAALAAMKYVVPIMVAQGSGSIITVASVNGVRAGLGGLCYSVAKAAAIHLTHCAAVELGEKGIRVNTISPGPIATGIFGKGAGLEPDEADANPDYAEAALAAVLPRWQPLPYVGRADDVARVALFLASDVARLITGHNLVVDGGICAGWPAGVVRDDITLFRKAFSKHGARARRPHYCRRPRHQADLPPE
jgi:NAD(P)-dependent dehydrogenase (short-subunit alcohol dehydrogenase family)